jgi:hypothetical protein
MVDRTEDEAKADAAFALLKPEEREETPESSPPTDLDVAL